MTTTPPADDFYVGHTPGSAPGHVRFALIVAVVVILLLAALGVLLAALQSPFDPGVFEFGETRTLRGTLLRSPQPRLLLETPLDRPETVTSGPPYVELLLVGSGKHGAGALEGLYGSAVEIRGTLIARGSLAMFELAAAPGRVSAPSVVAKEPASSERRQELVGEIVDSKCFLGVMKPGRGKVHRACATLCLEGGVPPAFVVRAPEAGSGSRPATESTWVAILLGPGGEPLEGSLAPWVGEPVRLEALVVDEGVETPRIHVDPASIRRLAD